MQKETKKINFNTLFYLIQGIQNIISASGTSCIALISQTLLVAPVPDGTGLLPVGPKPYQTLLSLSQVVHSFPFSCLCVGSPLSQL